MVFKFKIIKIWKELEFWKSLSFTQGSPNNKRKERICQRNINNRYIYIEI